MNLGNLPRGMIVFYSSSCTQLRTTNESEHHRMEQIEQRSFNVNILVGDNSDRGSLLTFSADATI